MPPNYYYGVISQCDVKKLKDQLAKYEDSFLIVLEDGLKKYLIIVVWHTPRGFRVVVPENLLSNFEELPDIQSEDLFEQIVSHVHEMYTDEGSIIGSLRIREGYQPWGKLIYADIVSISGKIWQ